LFPPRSTRPPAIDRQGASQDDVHFGATPDDADPTLIFRPESEMSAEERSRLVPPGATRPAPPVAAIQVTTRQSTTEADALEAKLDELRARAAQLTCDYERIEGTSRRAEDRATTIVERLAALTAVAEEVSRKSTETLRRLEHLSRAATAPPPVGQPWSVIGMLGVVALVSFMVTRPGEDAAQAGSNADVVKASIPADVVLPQTILSAAVPTSGRSRPTTPPAVKAQPQNVSVRPAGFIGTLAVQSDPPGAAVLVDRRRVGTTPIELPRLRAGSHLIWIEREGYQRWTASVLVPAEKLTRVRASLVLESRR